jgi:hypothetical protein
MYLEATPALRFRTTQNPRFKSSEMMTLPITPTEHPWVVILDATIAMSSLSSHEKSNIFSMVRDILYEQLAWNLDSMSLRNMNTNATDSHMELGMRFLTQHDARNNLIFVQAALGSIHSKIVLRFQESTDSTINSITASQFSISIRPDIVNARNGSGEETPQQTPHHGTPSLPKTDDAPVAIIVLAICLPILCISACLIFLYLRRAKPVIVATKPLTILQTVSNAMGYPTSSGMEFDSLGDSDSESLMQLIKKTKIDPAFTARVNT